MMDFVLPLVILVEFFMCHKILQHGTSGFTSPKEGVLWIFIALKIHCLGWV
jgi:hypothetical protein